MVSPGEGAYRRGDAAAATEGEQAILALAGWQESVDYACFFHQPDLHLRPASSLPIQ